MKLKLLINVGIAGVAATSALVGCRLSPSTGGPAPASAGVLADIQGMAPEDKTLPGISYMLFCDRGISVAGTPQGTGADEKIMFPGDRLESGLPCALEIRMAVPAGEEAKYVWNAKPAPQNFGLIYGSDKNAVGADRSLKLTLYKLFSRVSGDTFTTAIDVTFEVPTGARLPDFTRVSANLDCSSGQQSTGSYVGGTAANEGTFNFRMEPVKSKNATCRSITILESGVALFEGSLDETVKFTEPKKDDVIKFAKRFTVRPRPVNGNVSVTTVSGGCINFDAVNRKCNDRISVDLPRVNNYWVAKVEGKAADESRVTLYVTPSTRGNVDATGKTKTVKLLTTSLSREATAAEKDLFTWYSPSIESDLFSYPFDRNWVEGSYHSAFQVQRADLEGVKILHIEKIWFHGFASVAEAKLDRSEAARWVAVVHATKDSLSSAFLVAGSKDYFYSDKRRAGTTAAPKFFAWDDVKRDRDGATNFFKIYALKGGVMAQASCSATKDYYLNELSGKTLDQLEPSTAAARDAQVDSCALSSAQLVRDFDSGWQLTPTFYEFGWHEVQ